MSVISLDNIDGIPVTNGTIRINDLVAWIEARDASCAEYLLDMLKDYQHLVENK